MQTADENLPPDRSPAEGISSADERAIRFREIVAEQGPMLARYVRYRIVNASDAEDVLQETWIAVWRGVDRVREASLLGPWLLRVAQNRCRDYFRARERRESSMAEEVLEEVLQVQASRYGLRVHRQAETVREALEALESVAPTVREVARQFYLGGLTVAEIAAQTQSPPGTVKRHLFQARHAMRVALGVSAPVRAQSSEKVNAMKTQDSAAVPLGFPAARPAIRITPTSEPAFAVDCRELRSWPIVPVVGERAASADYFPPHWTCDEVTTLQALRAADVHEVEGVEIEVGVWKAEGGWQRPGSIYARLTERTVEFLAVHLPHEEFTQVETGLDDWFSANWGTLERAISPQGLLTRDADGGFVLGDTAALPPGSGIVVGVARVEIGDSSFTCLRVLEATGEDDLMASDGYWAESYLTAEGRTVLVRRFCQPRFAEVAQFPVVLDESERMVINGVTFVHWYDTIVAQT